MIFKFQKKKCINPDINPKITSKFASILASILNLPSGNINPCINPCVNPKNWPQDVNPNINPKINILDPPKNPCINPNINKTGNLQDPCINPNINPNINKTGNLQDAPCSRPGGRGVCNRAYKTKKQAATDYQAGANNLHCTRVNGASRAGPPAGGCTLQTPRHFLRRGVPEACQLWRE